MTDEWSSLELKKLLYFARARYRYAASPALNNAAVFFKSGSFYPVQARGRLSVPPVHGATSPTS
jgi:hypothetical protein